MYSLLPIYRFKFETQLNQTQISHHLKSLLKKEQNKKKKFEIHIQGADWGIEEYQGIIKSDFFKLKRYRYFSNDLKCFVYSGRVTPLDNGCIIQCTFRFDFILILMLIIFILIAGIQIVDTVDSKNINDASELIGIVIFGVLIYFSFIIGFNYRIKRVKELLEKKIRKR